MEITFVGQITLEKGIDLLIDVVQRLSQERKVRLNIIGNGTLKPILMKKTEGDPCINWVGFLKSPQEVSQFYAKSDVTVLPVRWDEAFSYIPLETMASGTPLIASRCGGNPETVTDGETGFLFTPGSADELYDILKKVDIKQLWDMGQKGRELILRRHTLKLFGDKYKALYENVLADPAHLHQID